MKTAFLQREYTQSSCLLDFYKTFHSLAYKEGVSEVVINFTARSGQHSNISRGKSYRWAGLQGFIDEIIVQEWGKFFAAKKEDAVADYKRVNEGGLGVPCDTSTLEALHDLGYMPLEFRALLEGMEVPYGVSAMTCRNTHPDFFFLPNMIETILSSEIWPVQTSLTTAVEYMKTVKEFAKIDGTPDFLIPFLCHDFSMRGMMGGRMEGGASLSGLGHLMSGFVGSDTIPAALKAEKNYGAYLGLDRPFETIASVPATEHSVQCSFDNDDLAYFRHCMRVSPTGILSLVSDGYDFWKLVTEILPQLKNDILARDGKIVIRPDSGDPVKVITGYTEDEIIRQEDGRIFVRTPLDDPSHPDHHKTRMVTQLQEYEVKGLIEVLYELFGGTDGAYKMLDEHIGAIYGDSITLACQRQIYERLHAKGFAVGNIVLGVGSFTYQHVTRDTHGSAVKATNMIIDGVDTPISKEVKGDVIKKSAKGRLVVIKDIDGNLIQIDQADLSNVEHHTNQHELVWKDGEWFRVQTLQDVREVVEKSLQ
jgi:nicotinamide phosphoribosyltransferase